MGLDRPIDVTADQRKTLLALLKRHLPNTTTWVYGSRVKWTARPQSDLDLVVFTTPDQGRRVFELREAFEESNLPFRVDLFVWDAVPEQFQKQIEVDHVVLAEKDERDVPSGWHGMTLGSLLSFSNGQASPERFDDLPHPVYGSNGIIGFSDETNAASHTIVVGRVGSYCGSLHYSDRTCWVTDNAIRANAIDENSARFLFYLLETLRLNDRRAGSGQPLLNQTILSSIPVVVPGPPEQRAIAQVLGTLDDKIELNRRMNETLDAMARALFKSWFIDFDPVHAKMALRNHSPLEGESAKQGRSPQASRWGEIKRQYTQQTLENAQTLRESRTDAEGLLWHYLRNKQLDGYKFRRQQPIGPYIVDFACMPQKLLIELDGSQHAERHTYDQKRDSFLREQGYKILRFWNNEIFENCFGVLESILTALDDHPPLEGGSKDESLSGRGCPPPRQPAPDGLASATPPQGGSDGTVERARAYLDSMDRNIADLFPDRLVDSELGPIPEGWEVSTIGQEVDVVGGSTPSTKDPAFWNGTINWVTPKDLSFLESPVLVETSRKITEKGLDNIGSGLLPRGTVLLSSRAPIGYLAISDVPVAINQGFIAMKCQKRLSATYAWLWTAANMAAILENANGSTFQEISKSNFRPLPVIVPSVSIRKIHDKSMQLLYDHVVRNERQSRTLTALRDALLPKLISGSMLVNNVEFEFEGVE